MNILKKTTIAVALGASALASTTASADLSASFAASNMYLWRGINISDPNPAVSGSLDYSHSSGLYAGIWGSSEGWFDNSSEYDLYAGFAGEAGSFSYDVSYVAYLYPSVEDEASFTFGSDPDGDISISDTDLEEAVIKLGFGGASLGAYIGVGDALKDSVYYTLGYAFDKYDVTYGISTFDGDQLYSHLTLGYAFNDEISFGLNFAFSDEVEVNEDPLFLVTYSKSWDM